MKISLHKKHFGSAFKTLRSSRSLLLLAPLGVFVGIGALIDATLLILQMAFLNPNSVSEKFHSMIASPWSTVAILIFLVLSVIAQNTVIINTYKRAHGKKVLGWGEIKLATQRLASSLAIHLASSFLLFAVISAIISIPRVNHALVTTLAVLIAGIVILTILTVKMIVLQMSVGGGHDLAHSVKATWRAFRDSWLSIVEHNVILLILNLVLLTIVAILGYLITLATVGVGAMIVVALNLPLGLAVIVPALLVTLIVIFTAGLLLIFNMATWSELTKSLRRRAVPSAMKHFAKTILPF